MNALSSFCSVFAKIGLLLLLIWGIGCRPATSSSGATPGGSAERKPVVEVTELHEAMKLPLSVEGPNAKEGIDRIGIIVKHGEHDQASMTLEADERMAERAEDDPPVVSTIRRVLVMAPGAPVLVEFRLRYEAESAESQWDSCRRRLLAVADLNQDSQVTWDELLSDSAILLLVFGRVPFEGDQQRATLARAYDRDGDGVVGVDEFARFLGRSQPDWDGLIVQGEISGSQRSIADSAIGKWLDQNGDGVLSTEDKLQADRRLRLRDADDDGRLWSADFIELTPEPLMMEYGSIRRGPRSVRLIHADTDWDDVQTDLEETYAFGSELTPDDWSGNIARYEALDTNRDEVLDSEELSLWATLPADVTWEIDLATSQSERIPHAMTRSDLPADSANVRQSSVGGRTRWIRLDWGRVGVAVMLEGRGNSNGLGYGGSDTLDDDAATLLMRADLDRNGTLSEIEYGSLGYANILPWQRLDRNEDQSVDLAELGLVVQLFAAYRGSATACTIQPVDDALFAALDLNRNGVLDAREIDSASFQLDRIDANRDGHLAAHELPLWFAFRLTRRPIYGAGLDSTARAAESVTTIDAEAADWFVQMDRNQDGEVSRREFLGSRTQFSGLDTNRDGYLIWQEAAEAVIGKVRAE